MEHRHHGRVSVVTGAGSGIGRAIARRLAGEGASIACLDANLDTANETVALIAESGGAPARAHHVDVRDRTMADTAIAAVVTEHGKVDHLVNCAGVVTMTSFDDLTEEEWDLVIDVNLKGYFVMAKACVDVLAKTEGAAIVNISTIEANVVVSSRGRCQVHYNASKGGVKMLNKALAVEFADRGIRVNAVAPGAIDTLFTGESIAGEEVMAFLSQRLLVPRLGQPEDVAAAASFLLSPDASYITGVQLPVDGGWLTR